MPRTRETADETFDRLVDDLHRRHAHDAGKQHETQRLETILARGKLGSETERGEGDGEKGGREKGRSGEEDTREGKLRTHFNKKTMPRKLPKEAKLKLKH